MNLELLYAFGSGVAVGALAMGLAFHGLILRWERRRQQSHTPIVVTHRVIRGWQEPAVKGFLRGDR